jgi:hypothetical protein
MRYLLSLVLVLLFLSSYNALPPQQPVIGVYTQDAEEITANGNMDTYIASSYIKNL